MIFFPQEIRIFDGIRVVKIEIIHTHFARNNDCIFISVYAFKQEIQFTFARRVNIKLYEFMKSN